MKIFDSASLNKFVKFGIVSDRKEREKIAENLIRWEAVPLEKTLISKKYQENINKIIEDKEINGFLSMFPHLKEEIYHKVTHLLEQIDLELNNESNFQYQEEINQIQGFQSYDFKEDYSFDLFKKHIPNEIKQTILPNLQAIEEEPKIERKKLFADLQKEVINEWENQIKNNKFRIRDRKKDAEKTAEEDELLNRLKQSSVEEFVRDWGTNVYHSFLKTIYSKKDLDLNKFTQNLKNIENQNFEKDINKIETLRNYVIEKLKENLDLKKFQQEIKIIDKLREQFLKNLYEEIEKLKELLKLLSPFIEDTTSLGRLWDLSKGRWDNINFNLLKEYAELLERKQEMKALAEALGRYRKAEVELREEEFTNWKITNKFKFNHFGKSEFVGITQSDDLNNLLPIELSLFSERETENIFFKKFSEKKLLSYQLVSKESYKEANSYNEKRQVQTEKDKGPFILAIDTSGSMHGAPEQVAKIIAFAITKIAHRDKRKAILISFSTNYEVFELTDFQKSLQKLTDFLQMSFHGGTDVSGAIIESIKKMQTENYEKADLLIITDGIFGNIDVSSLQQIEKLKQKGNKFNTLIIGHSQNSSALSFCDNVWFYDNNIGDLVQKINHTF